MKGQKAVQKEGLAADQVLQLVYDRLPQKIQGNKLLVALPKKTRSLVSGGTIYRSQCFGPPIPVGSKPCVWAYHNTALIYQSDKELWVISLGKVPSPRDMFDTYSPVSCCIVWFSLSDQATVDDISKIKSIIYEQLQEGETEERLYCLRDGRIGDIPGKGKWKQDEEMLTGYVSNQAVVSPYTSSPEDSASFREPFLYKPGIVEELMKRLKRRLL